MAAERIGINEMRHNMENIIKRVEAGEEILLSRNATMPDFEQISKTQTFFSLLKCLKTCSSVPMTQDEIKQWIEEGRT